MTTPVLTTDGVIGGGNAISTNSKYVERSVYFMQWINLNVKARNIFAYGIEGTHWNMNPEGNVTRTEAGTTNYLPAAWPQGTFFTQYVEAPHPANNWEGLLKTCLSSEATPLLGFVPDNSKVETEIAGVDLIWAQYSRALSCGSVEDPAADLANVLEQLKASGLDNIIQEYQAQVDAFLAAQ